MVVAPERAVVFPRLPRVIFRLDERDGEGQAVAAEGLGECDEIRFDSTLLEAEEVTGATTSRLNVVDDEQNTVLATALFQGPKPFRSGDIQSSFTLNCLDDHR